MNILSILSLVFIIGTYIFMFFLYKNSTKIRSLGNHINDYLSISLLITVIVIVISS